MAQLPPSSILCALGSLLLRRPGGLAHSQPGLGTLEAWCPCPSKWAPPIVPGRSPSSAVCVLQSLCLRPHPYLKLHARHRPRWGSVWLHQALLATIFCSPEGQDCLPHPSHPYYSAFCWEAHHLATSREHWSGLCSSLFPTADIRLWQSLTSLQPPSCPQKSPSSSFSCTPHLPASFS